MTDGTTFVLRVRVAGQLQVRRNYEGWALKHEEALHEIYERIQSLADAAAALPYLPAHASVFFGRGGADQRVQFHSAKDLEALGVHFAEENIPTTLHLDGKDERVDIVPWLPGFDWRGCAEVWCRRWEPEYFESGFPPAVMR